MKTPLLSAKPPIRQQTKILRSEAETLPLVGELMRRVKEARSYAERIDAVRGHTMHAHTSGLPGDSEPMGLVESLDQIIRRLEHEFFAGAERK